MFQRNLSGGNCLWTGVQKDVHSCSDDGIGSTWSHWSTRDIPSHKSPLNSIISSLHDYYGAKISSRAIDGFIWMIVVV